MSHITVQVSQSIITVTSLVTYIIVIVTILCNIKKDIEDSRMNDIIATELQHISLIYTVWPLRYSCIQTMV